MPGYYRRSLDGTLKEIKELSNMGIQSVLLFVKAPDEVKDNTGKEAWNEEGLMQRSITGAVSFTNGRAVWTTFPRRKRPSWQA